MELNRLIEIAKIQSTESSNRIEGIVTTAARLKQLVADKTTPRNKDEEEILGYRNVLNLVHENYDMIPVQSNYILQMHRDLLKYTSFTYGGKFKTTPNEIDMVTGNGEKIVLFKPLEPYETPDAVNMICESYQKALNQELVDELIQELMYFSLILSHFSASRPRSGYLISKPFYLIKSLRILTFVVKESFRPALEIAQIHSRFELCFRF